MSHPGVSGWQSSWRTVDPVSFEGLDAWERRLRRTRRRGWVLVVFLALFVAALVIGTIHDLTFPLRTLNWIVCLVSLAEGARGWRRARAARRALTDARQRLRDSPTAATMTIDWLVGHGDGPVAVAELTAVDTPEAMGSVTVVDVPSALADGHPVPVHVYGDPRRQPVAIDAGDAVWLWPEGTTMPTAG